MKKLLLIFSINLLIGFSAFAQQEVTIAKTYLSQNAAKQSLAASDIAEMTISSQYLSPTTGWYHIYFTQTYQSIEVYNGMLNTTLQNGEVKYVGNTFVPNIASLIPKNTTSSQSLSPIQAVQAAAKQKNLATDKLQQTTTSYINNDKTGEILKATFTDKTLSDEDIQVKKYWLPYETTENGKSITKVALTWNVQFLTKDHQNQWNMHVDVATGAILQERDDIIHCSFGESPKQTNAEKSHVSHTHIDVSNQVAATANSYNVFDYPLETPNHGSRSVVVSPYDRFVPATTFPGATNGWHNDGTTDFTTTRGNNVWAKEDVANDNETTIGASPVSPTLEFNYPYSQTLNSAAANQNAAITNLFYWNNVMHDVLWKYGFDEPSGNFQTDNQGRGGAGGDFVQADAQDGGGVNNANFRSPNDGGNGRMQMYLGDLSNVYQPDGSFDNGVIAHEYGHGWSNRLTGGPANSGCLQNVEQAGEGWSDYIALMTTTNWASLTPTVASANIPRGIGTYFFGEPTTGNGIRPFRYSYDMANINPTVTYAGVGNSAVFSQPHGIGSIWATMLWDMTWEIILQDNFIAPTIYDVPANIADYKGNIAALKLVNEGLRMQPCSPSFVQARDAILQADASLFGGRYKCNIWKAFARRGLGFYASTGSITNDRNVSEDFTPFVFPELTSPLQNEVCSGQPFTYVPTVAESGTYTFSWSRAAVAGISNTAASGTGNINETLISTNTTQDPIVVQYLISVSPNACGNTPAPQRVNVIVKNIVTPLSSPLNETTYNGAVYTYTATTDAVGSYTYSWTRAAVAGISNPAASGDNATISEALVNTTQKRVTVQYQFIVSPNVCGNTPQIQTLNVVVDPLTFNLESGNYTICQNATVPVGEGLVPPTRFTTINRRNFNQGYIRGRGSNVTTYTPGSQVVYGQLFFVASITGPVTFTATPNPDPGAFQFPYFTNLTLYTSFDRVNPADNFLRGNESIIQDAPVSLTENLTEGNSYTLVYSTFSGNSFELTIESSPAIFTYGGGWSWYTSPSGGSPLASGPVFNPIGVTGSGISNTATLGTTTFYAKLSFLPYRYPFTFTVSESVEEGRYGGVVSSNAVYCSSTNAGTLTLSGHTGTILRWESSVDNFATATTIANTSTSLEYTNVTTTTKYRAVVQNGICTSYSQPASFVINPTRLFVNKNATGANNGASWRDAFTDVQEALNLSCPSVTEIWVAKGTYKPAAANGDQSVSFNIRDNLKVYGGFSGTEMLLTDRNYSLIHTTNSTILSGDLNGDDGANFANNAENSYSVVRMNNVSNNSQLDGFTITKGNGSYLRIFSASGAGILMSNSSPTIENCRITSNYTPYNGAGVVNINGEPLFNKCTFSNNKSEEQAGAIFNISDKNPDKTLTISNSVFLNNSAVNSWGSILYNISFTSGNILEINFTNCSLTGNSSPIAAIYSLAGQGATINTTIKNSIFFNNGVGNTFGIVAGNFRTYNTTATHSLFESSVTGYTGTNNVISDISPFVSTTDLRLPCGSLATNSGTSSGITATDFDGNPRPYAGTLVDMGAYELQGGTASDPTGISVSSREICLPTNVTLSANCAVGFPTWYAQATGGTALGTGASFVHSPNTNTTYYVACANPCATSSRLSTSEVVVANSAATLALTSDFNANAVQIANTTISATNKVINPAKVVYKAGNSVTLNQGFEARNGSTFLAQIGRCQNVDIPGLVAYYPFNGNANDATGNGFNGIINGATLSTDKFGVAQKALNFAGIASVRIPNLYNAVSQPLQNVTYSLWFKPNQNYGAADFYSLIIRTTDAGFTDMIGKPDLSSVENNKFQFYMFDNVANVGRISKATTINFTANQWVHVVATRANGTMKIYLNAVKEGETAYPNPSVFYPDLYLGGHSTFNRWYFNGAMDDLRIYNRALSDAEVQAIYNAEKP
jgi:hypothetical protein